MPNAAPHITTVDEKRFIMENKDRMKQCEIARHLKVSTSLVSQIISGKKAKTVEVNELFFNVDSYLKHYNF